MAVDVDIDALRANVAPLASTDHAAADFDDLNPLGRAVADRRLVQLGEQSHSDGATFDAKVRLVRYLHQSLGFDLIAWESGLYSCRFMQERLAKGVPVEDALATGIFPIWHLRPVEQLLDYAKSQQDTKPIEMCGFDIQLSSRKLGPDVLLADAERALGWPVAGSRPLGLCEDGTVSTHGVGRLVEGLLRIRTPGSNGLNIDWLIRSLMGLRAFQELEAAGVFERGGEPDQVAHGINVRDALMADNLLWLLDEVYPGRRAIVWGASFHIARNLSMLSVPEVGVDYRRLVTMGQHLHAALGDAVYTVVFTAGSGTAGNPVLGTYFDIDAPNPGSLEAGMLELGHDCAFLDLSPLPQESPLRGPLEARPFGYVPMIGDWGRVVDGFVFTSSMYPAAPMKGDA